MIVRVKVQDRKFLCLTGWLAAAKCRRYSDWAHKRNIHVHLDQGSHPHGHLHPQQVGLASSHRSTFDPWLSFRAASRRHIHACPRLTTQCVVQNYPHANARLSHSATAAKQRGAHDTAIDVADDRPARRGRDAHSRTDHNRREYDDVEGDGEDKGEIDPRFAAHLNRLFLPLEFPPELAQRLLTHGSHKAAARGHNARFSFLGTHFETTLYFCFLFPNRVRLSFF